MSFDNVVSFLIVEGRRNLSLRDRCILREHKKRMELIDWKIKNAMLEHQILSTMKANTTATDSNSDEILERLKTIHHLNDTDVTDVFDI